MLMILFITVSYVVFRISKTASLNAKTETIYNTTRPLSRESLKNIPGWRPEPLDNRLCIYADLRFSSFCSASQEPLRFFFLNFLVKFSNRSLFLPFRKRDNLPSSRNPKPKISRPMSISHEPGVRGVIKAKKPRIMQIMPIDFFAIFFIRLKKETWIFKPHTNLIARLRPAL